MTLHFILLMILYFIPQQKRLGACGALGPAALRAVGLEHRAETDNVMPQGRMNKAAQVLHLKDEHVT